MYATCLFCHHHLGRNQLVPGFTVGRRLAFDPARGRLWVVCEHCHRWNLTAMEERWEALESCEQLFRDTPLRISTDNVGLAVVPEGLTLVRVGRAPRPEIAAWRYGRLLRAQLRRHPAGRLLARAAGDAAQAAGMLASSVARTLGHVGIPRPGYDAFTWLRIRVHAVRPLALVPGPLGEPFVLRWSHLEGAELIRPERREPWRIVVRHANAALTLAGDEGLRTAGKLLAALNGAGATAEHVQAAIRKVDDAGNPDGYFARIAALALRTSWGRHPDAVADGPMLPVLASDAERRAMDGELTALEAAWREAEEIAAIADALPLVRAPRSPAAWRPRLGEA